ncbi:hypothetical protein GCM10023224_51150 [Streptomonospora halophila]|uniref:Uncharacterized protein n=1 Tax=Streptomonospora halophila TaxID=427369 RepID=A0ABP9H211_9ACTN
MDVLLGKRKCAGSVGAGATWLDVLCVESVVGEFVQAKAGGCGLGGADALEQRQSDCKVLMLDMSLPRLRGRPA